MKLNLADFILYNSRMDSLEIKPLVDFDPVRLWELVLGYTSSHKFEVTKSESPEKTSIEVTLHELDEPYVKRWEPKTEMESHYQDFLDQGLSLGLYKGLDLVGVALAEKREWNRTLWVWEFHIDPEFQGQGHGRRLMEALADLGKQAGCRVMVCETQNTNVPAIQFYRKMGFEIGAVDLSYYTNKDAAEFEVAIFMKRYLEP